ncbi:LPS export ABC transporter periplasmic protein LptC [Halovibrio salipaludis]|uniref:LPS export ABC transporter periplasmic protein LptC n=1 Tax=Halovibrio salipaludis TaxID=2032626 RepID=A0A2A2EZA6_9GAMM|nr:LPS export ABC transporter periplasmic protein LptC [Halovibrio salipaludis]PAU78711.1 LPS export ABC transporter periplasmic protein LptC [Halovibrio salipaludis]
MKLPEWMLPAWLRDRSIALWGIVGVVLLGLALLVLQEDDPIRDTTATDLRGPQKPDGFVVNATFRAFDSEGRLKSRIRTRRAEQFQDENRVTMERPRAMLMARDGGAPWFVRSRTGLYRPDVAKLMLEKDVRARHSSTERGDVLILSERMTLDNNERIVQTDAPVTLIDRSSVTNAVGMTGWIDERAVRLENDVRSRYFNR